MTQAIADATPFNAHARRLFGLVSRRIGSAAPCEENRKALSKPIGRIQGVLLLLNSFLPFVLGFAIYTLWRSTKLLMFRGYRFMGIYEVVAGMRSHVVGIKHLIPGVFLYSVPDALWVYSATAALSWLWFKHPRRDVRVFWILLPMSLAVGSEIGQFFGLVMGTFDWTDVTCYLLAGASGALSVPLLMHWRARQTPSERSAPASGIDRANAQPQVSK